MLTCARRLVLHSYCVDPLDVFVDVRLDRCDAQHLRCCGSSFGVDVQQDLNQVAQQTTVVAGKRLKILFLFIHEVY